MMLHIMEDMEIDTKVLKLHEAVAGIVSAGVFDVQLKNTPKPHLFVPRQIASYEKLVASMPGATAKQRLHFKKIAPLQSDEFVGKALTHSGFDRVKPNIWMHGQAATLKSVRLEEQEGGVALYLKIPE